MNFLNQLFLNFGLPVKFADVLSFFIFEIFYLSIILMFALIIFTFIRVKFLGEDFAQKLNKQPKFIVYLGMALLGIISPFCSCSTIPVFISFSALGIPTGALFVFLITSPMVQETSLMLLLTQFGIPVAITYVLLGTMTGILAGLILSKASDSELFNDNILSKRNNSSFVNVETSSCCEETISCCEESTSCCGETTSCCEDNTSCCDDSTSCCGESNEINPKTQPFKYAVNNSVDTFKSMFKYMLIGIGIGAFVYGFVPDSLIQNLLGSSNLLAPILATLVGIPTYADDVALIPIAKTLVDGGAGLGTALAFVMSSAIVSVPSFVMLGSALKKKTLVKLAICLSICITIIGYILNYISPFIL